MCVCVSMSVSVSVSTSISVSVSISTAISMSILRKIVACLYKAEKSSGLVFISVFFREYVYPFQSLQFTPTPKSEGFV